MKKAKVSRQRVWQKKMRSQGRCPICGVSCKPYAKCKYHRKKDREAYFRMKANRKAVRA